MTFNLWQVITTFCYFLIWYAFFIVAFGLGFYILLHKKPEEKTETKKDATAPTVVCEKDDYEFFNSPWLSLIKTSTMFTGELVRHKSIISMMYHFLKDTSIKLNKDLLTNFFFRNLGIYLLI